MILIDTPTHAIAWHTNCLIGTNVIGLIVHVTIFSSGDVPPKRVRRKSLVDSAEVIKAAGESSQTDPSAFIEQQRQILNEVKSSKPSGNRDNEDKDVVMQDEDRRDVATKLDFKEEHFRSMLPYSSVRDDQPITTQPGRSNFESQEVAKMYAEYVNIETDEYVKLIGKHDSGRGGKCKLSSV